MRSPVTTRTAGLFVLTLGLLCSAAGTSRAADEGLFINEQIQLGDVFSTQTLNVEEAPEGVGATTTAVGNIVAGTGQNARIDFQSAQSIDQQVGASTHVAVDGVTGEYFFSDTSATGNSGTAGTCCALTLGSSNQWINDGAVVSADAYSQTGAQAGSISVDAAAVGNTQGWNQVNGEVQAWTQQMNSGLTSATNIGDFHSSPGNIGLTATAVTNNVSGDVENAYLSIGVQQDRTGPGGVAVVDAFIGSGVDIQGVATASGNLVDVIASSPLADMNVSQSSSAGIDAYSNLTINQWSGDANSIAYGVGNSIVMSNNGPVTTLFTQQASSGDINGTAALTGGTGNAVFASSTAIGNAVSGYACSECGGDFGGFNRQVNSSRVRSQSNVVITGRAGLVATESTAIGNSATYQVYSNGN